MECVKLALRAMATRFELVLYGEDVVHMRAAGEAALEEIRLWEQRLSYYRPTSEIGRINAFAAKHPVRVDPQVFTLLQTAKRYHRETDGAFDVTVGPLMRCWGLTSAEGRIPEEQALQAALQATGMHLVHLDQQSFTVSYERPGVEIDLGGIGKGFAIDEAIILLEENGIASAFLHGGTSTIYALGNQPDGIPWKTAIPNPGSLHDEPGKDDIMTVVSLENEALSVSAVSGKSFTADGIVYGHVLNPASGYPVQGAEMAAVIGASAMETDVLSTALLVQGLEGVKGLERRFGVKGIVSPKSGVRISESGARSSDSVPGDFGVRHPKTEAKHCRGTPS